MLLSRSVGRCERAEECDKLGGVIKGGPLIRNNS
jgi:hypothetical protein